MNTLRGRVLGIVTTAAVTTGSLALWSGAASAVTCPTVAHGTGIVTPAPAPGVNWSGCNLAGANLSSADLSGADLSGANVEVANLTGSNLNTDTWAGATCPDGTSANSDGGDCSNAFAFPFAGFIAPKPGSTVAASARHVTVRFNFATSSHAIISASIASAIATAKEVRVTLAGPGIKAASAYCSWDASVHALACSIADTRGIEKGKSHSYTITVDEKAYGSFQTAPRLGKAANPETIHFA